VDTLLFDPCFEGRTLMVSSLCAVLASVTVRSPLLRRTCMLDVHQQSLIASNGRLLWKKVR